MPDVLDEKGVHYLIFDATAVKKSGKKHQDLSCVLNNIVFLHHKKPQ
jgi:hypothetical protein